MIDVIVQGLARLPAGANMIYDRTVDDCHTDTVLFSLQRFEGFELAHRTKVQTFHVHFFATVKTS